MAMPINTGVFSKLLWPGVKTVWDQNYADWEDLFSKIFMTVESDRAFEEDVMFTDFGLMQQKPEGAPVSYDTIRQGYTTRYTPVVYSSGFIITREAYEDNLYKKDINLKASSLARAVKQTRETIAWNVINRAFNTSYLGGDGKALIVSDHPNFSGGTRSNVLTTSTPLSEAGIEDLIVQMMNMTTDRGLKMKVSPQKLVIPPTLMFEAQRILKSDQRPGTTNNDTNVLNRMGLIKDVIVSPYLTSTTAWFITTDKNDNGLKYIKRRGDEFGADNDWETENAKYKVTSRYAFGWTDWLHIFGTPGT